MLCLLAILRTCYVTKHLCPRHAAKQLSTTRLFWKLHSLFTRLCGQQLKCVSMINTLILHKNWCKWKLQSVCLELSNKQVQLRLCSNIALAFMRLWSNKLLEWNSIMLLMQLRLLSCCKELMGLVSQSF